MIRMAYSCRRPLVLALAPALAALPLALPAAPARACGGLFCDGGGNMPIPVDQTGENVLFAVDEQAGTVEAHIQIQYTGDPQKFGWVIPVTAVPEFAIGSELLFTNLLNSTVPTYGSTTTFDCQQRDPPSLGCSRGDLALSAGDTDGDFETGGLDTSEPGPDIVKREIVGAYEIVVLQGGTSKEVFDWLSANGYFQDADAVPILDAYLQENYYFAAARLLHSAGVDAIQPIVMTYAGDRPCVPLRLTRIAATPNMGVRVFGLGHSRYVPSNYKHVELNEVRLDWDNNALNYNDVVQHAVDAPGADGHAFVTEFASSSSLIDRTGLWSPAWDSQTFVGASPVSGGSYTIIDALETQGLVDCSTGFDCSYLHPQILPILRSYLPTPPGIAEADFYSCMECYEAQIDPVAWDAAAFAKALEDRIIAPGKRAIDLLDRWQSVTRLFTVISPEEMTVDPEFVQNPDLPPLMPTHTATRFVPCAGSDKMVLPDESAVLLDESATWPEFDDTMPWARRIETLAPAGAPQVDVDFSPEIDAALRASNRRFDYDNGTGVQCALGSASWSGALSLVVIFGFAARGRRRRARA